MPATPPPSSSPPPPPPTPPSARTPGKTLGALVLGALSVLYILNPSAGLLEFIPDNFPIVGNLDEAAAVVILANCLAYFGFDLGALGRRGRPRDPVEEAKNVTPPGGFGR